MADMQWLGGVVIEPTRLRCAIVACPDASAPVNPEKIIYSKVMNARGFHDAATEAASFFKASKAKRGGQSLDGLSISMFGLVDTAEKFFRGSTKDGYEKGAIGPLFEEIIGIPRDRVCIYNEGAIDALVEYHHGSILDWEQELHKELFYLKVKTYGIVGALISKGFPREELNPEIGHSLGRRHPADTFEGRCRAHKDCLAGLADGLAMQNRWAVEKLSDLPKDDTAWILEAYYIAQLCVIATLAFAPWRIIIGGEVMRGQPHLYPQIRGWFKAMISEFPNYPALDEPGKYIQQSRSVATNSFDSLRIGLRGTLEAARLKEVSRIRVVGFPDGSSRKATASSKDHNL